MKVLACTMREVLIDGGAAEPSGPDWTWRQRDSKFPWSLSVDKFFSQITDSLKLNEILGNIYLFWVTSKNTFKISCNEHDIGFENSDPGPKVELQSERKWRLLDHSPCDKQLEQSESRSNFCFLIEILLFFNSSNLYLSENLDLMNEIFGVQWRD